MIMTTDYMIDASDKILGRIASEAAFVLRGKNSVEFEPHKLSGHTVTIINTDRVRVTGTKMRTKLYRRHSGYPGGLFEEKLEDLLKRDSRRVIQSAVMGMLPKNRLRAKMIRNLKLFKQERG